MAIFFNFLTQRARTLLALLGFASAPQWLSRSIKSPNFSVITSRKTSRAVLAVSPVCFRIVPFHQKELNLRYTCSHRYSRSDRGGVSASWFCPVFVVIYKSSFLGSSRLHGEGHCIQRTPVCTNSLPFGQQTSATSTFVWALKHCFNKRSKLRLRVILSENIELWRFVNVHVSTTADVANAQVRTRTRYTGFPVHLSRACIRALISSILSACSYRKKALVYRHETTHEQKPRARAYRRALRRLNQI